MHHFRNRRTATRIVVVALLEWLKWGMATSSLALLVCGILLTDREWILMGGWLATGAVLAQAVVFFVGRRTACPLCMTPVLGYPGCSSHRRMKRIIGSLRLKVAWDVLVHRRFTCPYCNERVAVSSRQ